MTDIFHGGDLAWAEHRFGRPSEPWIDLSTGINPWPYPTDLISDEPWRRLPDGAASARLSEIAARYYGAPGADTVVPAPGTQMLIQWLPRLRPPSRVAVVSPTYSEHAKSWKAAGHELIEVADIGGAASADVVVITNPNNPDGRVFRPDELNHLADRLASNGGWLVVDEAFADTASGISLVGSVTGPGRILLRSFGKFFGLAGLRLGFALASPDLADALRASLGPWSVSGPAIEIGCRALADSEWIDATRTRLAEAARDLDALLASASLRVIGGTTLFRLAAHPRAPDLFERLGRAGILVRSFPDHPTWLRFGLPADQAATRRLRTALESSL